MSTEAVNPASGHPDGPSGDNGASSPGAPAKPTKSRVLQNWDKEDPAKWQPKRAWLTLWVTTFSLIIGFCVWYLVSAVAPKLNDVGFDLSSSQLYWLVAVPGLSGGIIRLIYMFLPPLVGTRNLVGSSSSRCLGGSGQSKTRKLHTRGWWCLRRSLESGAAVSLGICPRPGTSSPNDCRGLPSASRRESETSAFP